jgi:glutamine synthetase
MIRMPSKTLLEYIWIGGKNEIRSKARVINRFLKPDPSCIPDWNYDGSSTWQADSNSDTEITLKPCAVYKNPLRSVNDCCSYLVVCDTYDSNGNPTETNHRYLANKLFEKGIQNDPWFGLEQEYFIFNKIASASNIYKFEPDGLHYCGKTYNLIERAIAEEHMKLCIEADILISGINSEVAYCQWEFQIGPVCGIAAGDSLIVARYLLERVAEKYDSSVTFEPKPIKDISGSGCHINFSTVETRSENGIEVIYQYIRSLKENHKEVIKNYGVDNHLRLTGLHETSSYNEFTWGIGTRNTSIRIPNQASREKCGYFEDRRPAANIDPYLATSSLFKTCCLTFETE